MKVREAKTTNKNTNTNTNTRRTKEKCSQSSSSKSARGNLKTHSHGKRFKCPEPNCEYSAVTTYSMKQHGFICHLKEGEERPTFPCPICDHSSKTKEDLPKHIKTHTLEKLFKCDEPNCNYEARRKCHLESHKVVHSDEKPFVCPVESCEYRCKHKYALQLHLRTHSDEKVYKCELCSFRSKQRQNVRNHIKQVHSDLRPFKCTEPKCDSAFKRKDSLNTHLLTHKGEKKYSCSFPDCDYKSVSAYNVKAHQERVHDKEKRFSCGLCDYATSDKSTLVKHSRTHTKEEPFRCKEPGCDYRAKRSGLLKKHRKKYHPQI